MSASFEAALGSLQRRWGVIVFLYALGLSGLGLFLRAHLSLTQTLLWLGLSGLIGFYILSYLYIRLPDNIRPGELDLSPWLGPGTALSLVGGWLLAALGGFLILPKPEGAIAWLPALLYLLALLADLFDGMLARRARHTTRLGADLDMMLDGLGVLLAAGLAVRWGKWPFWFLIVGLARYLFVWGLAWRQRHGLPVRALEDSSVRRLLAGMQRGFLFVALWPVAPGWLTTIMGLAFVIPFLVNFTYDWLTASTVIDPDDPDFRAVQRRWRRLARGPIALAVRLLTAAFAALALWQAHAAGLDAWQALAHTLGLPAAVGMAFWWMGALLTPLFALGIAPRLSVALLYIPMGAILWIGVGFWPALLAFYGLTLALLLGPGPWALWQPEAPLFTRRLGQKDS